MMARRRRANVSISLPSLSNARHSSYDDGRHDVAVLALHDDADLRALVVVHPVAANLDGLRLGQAARFEDQRALGIVVQHDLRVGRVAGVLVAEPAAEADDARRERLRAVEPAGDVHLMDALVAHVAVAGVVVPVPIVVQLGPIQIDLRRRAAPQVVVDVLGNLQRLVELADGLPRLVARADDAQNLAELAAVNELDGFLDRAGSSGPACRIG